jgi:hypothetical protein
MNVQDDLYTGPSGPNGFVLYSTSGPQTGNPAAVGEPAGDPTRQYGVGPLGRTVFLNIVPLALATANIATLQAPTAQVPLALAVGTGIVAGVAPDGSGSTVYFFDCARCVSLTSTANLSGITFLVTAYDKYGQKWTQLVTGPNNNTVTTLKAAVAVLSVVPQGTSASTLSVGSSDIFGLPFRCIDAGYVLSAKWAGVLAQNAGTFTAAALANPATNLTGDTRGTYAQSGPASNGVNRLLIGQYVDGSQCGANATLANAIGVPQA